MNEQSDKTARNLCEPNHQSDAVVSASNNNKNMFKGQNNENENERQSDETEEFLTKEAGNGVAHMGSTNESMEFVGDQHENGNITPGVSSFQNGVVSNSEFNLPHTAILLETNWGSNVYVVGTAHFSEQSQEDVAKVIQAVQPNFVVLELCESRSYMLKWEENEILKIAEKMEFKMVKETIRNYGVVQGVMYLLLLSVSAQITRELGMAPGGEFRRAYKEAANVPGEEDIEKCKNRDYLEEMLAMLGGEFPELKTVFVNERDLFLCHTLTSASLLSRGPHGVVPNTVVGVVGMGHLAGIQRNWEKFDLEEVRRILIVPPPSRTAKFIKLTLKTSVLVLALYGVHKLACKSETYASLFR
ncbi:hypothetical protein RUM43_008352 [Polyplax serrata]|uniref:TraB domain-containing protein n=1 Tax=Polyplax serrata TaxID=468196 RepID=A0AAN8P6X8_POLSC